MKNCVFIFLFLLVSRGVFSQVVYPTSPQTSYDITSSSGAINLTNTQSITLKPNTWIHSGATFSATIVDETTAIDPYTVFSFSNENYVFTRSFQKAMSSFNSSTAKEGDVIESIGYFDGIGRPIQNIAIKASSDKKDIVTHITYDNLGRQDKSYLPYAESSTVLGTYKTNALSNLNSFYNTDKYENTLNPYSQNFYDGSPLNLIIEKAAPGNPWKEGITDEHTIKEEYDLIQESDNVYNFSVSFSGDIPILNTHGLFRIGEYTTGAIRTPLLFRFTTKNENWKTNDGNKNTSQVFKDYRGRTILSRIFQDDGLVSSALDTYYVYDNFNNLAYVISPKVDVSNGISTSELNELCYQYKYDARNRLIEKKLPGKGKEYIVYNKLNQPIMTQDANMANKSTKEWLYTKYDRFGRIAYTGKALDNRSRSDIQAEVNGLSSIQWVKQQTAIQNFGDTSLYYNNTAYPTTTLSEIFSINYYDTYVDTDGLTVPSSIFGQSKATNNKSLATVSKVKVLTTSNWITSISGYDNKGRIIYSASKNNYLGTTDIVETELDFAGKIKRSKASHQKGSNASIITNEVFVYDHEGRMLRHKQKINENEEVVLTDNVYDNLGQLMQKKVGGDLQTVDYKYNIRGWLRQINDPASLGSDMFAFKINYNTSDYGGAKPLFNGNVTGTEWRTANTDNRSKRYNFTYDVVNRIKTAISNDGKFDLGSTTVPVTYDKNGNIIRLVRKGNIVANPIYSNVVDYGIMDDLTYSYDVGNRLRIVSDAGNDIEGFKDDMIGAGTDSTTDYTYDVNGNMKTDTNKGITDITYNYFNLPTEVSIGGGTISYIYDATGVKQKKIISSGITTSYAGNYVYEKLNNGSDVLKFFNHSEGYVDVNAGAYKYVFQYKDHLGNIRLSYAKIENGVSIDENYYNQSGANWALSSGSVGSITHDNPELDINLTNAGNSAYRIIEVMPNTPITFEFEFGVWGSGTMEYPYVGIQQLINGVWQNVISEQDSWDLYGATSLIKQISFTSNMIKVSIVKSYADDNGYLTIFHLNKFKATQNLEIIDENNYYPFGLEHKGYNASISPNSNTVASKFTYNSTEFENGLGFNLYEMDQRQYDPSIARWTGIDPVTHHSMSTYTAFDNNPAFWADPSGANSTGDIDKMDPRTREFFNGKTLYGGGFSFDGNSISVSGSTENPNPDCCGETKVQKATRIGITAIADKANELSKGEMAKEADDLNVDAYKLFYQWVHGTGSKTHNFTEGSVMGMQMLKSKEVLEAMEKIKSNVLSSNNTSGEGFARSLGKEVKGSPMAYVIDFYKDIEGRNPARGFHGSFRGEIAVNNVVYMNNGALINMTVNIADRMTATSGTRLSPLAGGYDAKNPKTLYPIENPYGPNGQFRTIEVNYNMTLYKYFLYND